MGVLPDFYEGYNGARLSTKSTQSKVNFASVTSNHTLVDEES